MLMEFNSKDADLILKLCEHNGIDVRGIFATAFDACVSAEFDRLESYYKGIIGDETLKRVRKEAEEEIDGIHDVADIKSISNILDSKLDLVCTQLDSKPKGVYVFSNNMSLSLISLNDDTALLKDGNNIFECELSTDSEGDYIVKYKELELNLNEFILI